MELDHEAHAMSIIRSNKEGVTNEALYILDEDGFVHELKVIHCFWVIRAISRLSILLIGPLLILNHFTVCFVSLCHASTSIAHMTRLRIW